MNTAQWPQEIVVKPLEEIVTNPTCPKPASLERKPRPQKDQNLNCPRCNSTNTKFCYYNNYSLTQPRYFCKTCRRYWTEGGTLRNIPVGGGTRKNKRSAPSSTSSSTPSKKLPDLVNPPLFTQSASHHQNPKMVHEGQDLNLGFTASQDLKTITELVQVPSTSINTDHHSTGKNSFPTASTSNTSHQVSALELINGIASRGLSSFMAMPVSDSNSVYTPGFSLQEFKPNLNFSLDGFGGGFGNVQGVQESNNGRLLFPFEDLQKQGPSAEEGGDHHQGKVQGESSGYWTGMLGGGSW